MILNSLMELLEMRSTPSLSSLPGSLWPEVVVFDRDLSMGQTELFVIYIECKELTYAKLNCLK